MDIRRLGGTGYNHGLPIVYDEVSGKWLYMDTLEPIDDDNPRPCPRCGNPPLEHDEDCCLGHIPGVSAACCGHGVERAYLMFEDGSFIQGTIERVRAYAGALRSEDAGDQGSDDSA